MKKSKKSKTDSDYLLSLHQTVLEAHLQSDAELLLKDEPDDYTVANRGEISHPSKKARKQRLDHYLKTTHFREYRDEVPPIVNISQDKTLGWVVVQVYAQGEQTASDGKVHPIQFVSAWIELYEKRDGRWLRIGNVSNFKN